MTKSNSLGPRLCGNDELGWCQLLDEASDRCGTDERLWRHFLNGLSVPVRRRLLEEWHWQAHGGQRVPVGDWTVWLLMAGRGFGKTRAGAEWVWGKVRGPHTAHAGRESPSPRDGEGIRIALVGATREDAVRVMVEGPSGLLRLARPDEEVRWVATRGELQLPGGALAFVYSAGAPEALRGPEHDFAWVDELGKWPPAPIGQQRGRGDEAWDNLMMGLRLGPRPQAMVTTTPRTTVLMKRVLALPGVAVTRGRTADNLHVPDAFKHWAAETYGGTRLGRQELDGEWIEEVEGSLFPWEVIEAARFDPPPAPPCQAGEYWRRIVIGVDPPASSGGDACGIVVCGQLAGEPPLFVVLADCSVSGLRPEGWARAVARAAEAWGADRVVAERNQGGEMVGAVLRHADCLLPVTLVHASRGKAARAEPVAALTESGRVRLAGRFPALEAELNALRIDGSYAAGGSPDRADACVWALSALIEGARKAEPRVVAL